jgi:ABC-2 type transport system permease protein
MWNRIRALIYKEFLSIFRDKKSRFALIMPPVIQLVLFASAATLDVTNVRMGILNRDTGEQGFELVQRFERNKTFTHIDFLKSVEEIKPYIDTKKGVMVLSIDEQFSRNLDAMKPASIQLILDGRKSNTTQIVAGYASTIVNQFNQDFEASANLIQKTTELVPRNWYNPNLLYQWFTVPSLCAILTMIEAVIITAMSVARERELETFDQLLVSPMRPIEILIGKTIPAVVIAIFAATFMILAGIFVFRIPFTGSLLPLYCSMIVFIFSVVGIGLFVSSLCYTQQQAVLGSFVFMSPSISLSGFATPIENMPDWLQIFTYVIPLRYFLVIVRGSFLKEMPASIIFENTWPMAIIAIFTLTGAAWFFRNRLE